MIAHLIGARWCLYVNQPSLVAAAILFEVDHSDDGDGNKDEPANDSKCYGSAVRSVVVACGL